jgi:hypothetical protein
MRYPITYLSLLVTLAVTIGFCTVFLLTVLDFLDLQSESSEIRVEDGFTNAANSTTPITTTPLTSRRLETPDADRLTDSSNIRTDTQLGSSTPQNDTNPSDDVGPTRIAMPAVLPNIEKRTEILPLTIEISMAALTADYQSLIASGRTTSEAIRIIDQYVSEGKYGAMGKRPNTLESAESIFLSDYDRLISSGIAVDEAISKLAQNVPTGRYGIYADVLFPLLEDDLSNR